jgi:hypothetical protein
MMKTLVVSLCLLGGVAGAGEPERRTPLYTNADLERARAGRPAGAAEAASAAPEHPARERDEERLRRREEAYWRAEADRVRGRLLALRAQLEELETTRTRLQAPQPARQRTARRQPQDPGALDATARRIEALRRRIAEEEMRFLDRARQAGALPGWVRSVGE